MNNQPQPSLFKIRSGKLQIWQQWCIELRTTLASEAAKTIAEEGEMFEFFIIIKIGDTHYTIGGGIVNDGSRLRPSNPTNPINQRHKQIKDDCLEFIGKCDYGYLLKGVNERPPQP